MKILKIFGVVVGIHAFALILIFANPGCSSTSKPAPQPADTVARAEPAPMITLPSAAPAPQSDIVTPAPVGFNPDAPATYAGSGGGANRFMPTRPNTPAASAVLTQPVENVTPATSYKVKSGDNLWNVAKRFHVSYKDIAKENNLKTNAPLHEGQVLIIPSKSGSAPAASSTKSQASAAASSAPAASSKSDAGAGSKGANGEVTYTVRAGDTIESIAKRFEVKWKDLAVHNNIDNPARLRPGTILNIPGWKSTSGSSRSGTSRSTASESKSAPAPAAEPKPIPNLMEPDQAPAPQTPSPASNSVPVIDIQDNSGSPAPKS